MDNNIENIESGQSKGGIMGLERKDLAVERKHRIGCNCCQAVLLAFADEIKECWSSRKAAECVAAGGVSAGDEIFLKALGSGFGSGMGGMDATCGALVGAGMVLGLVKQKAPGWEKAGCRFREAQDGSGGRIILAAGADLIYNSLIIHARKACERMGLP